MKKILVACFSGMLVFSACHNEGSSTVGVYENADSNPSETKEEPVKEEQIKEKPQKSDTTKPALDTAKTVGE